MGKYNVSGRSFDDAIVALSIDSPRGSSFAYQVLETSKYYNGNGGGHLHLLGLAGVDGRDPGIYLINNQPSIGRAQSPTLEMDSANQTIEQFHVDLSVGKMEHVRTYADSQIATPNNIAIVGDAAFYFTNDHGPHKTGFVCT